MPSSKSVSARQRCMRAALVLRDNVRNRSRIEKAYLRAIGSARREVIIANAYFVPGRKLRKALLMAARRGVRVRLLLQGRYEYFMQYHAARPVYGRAAGGGGGDPRIRAQLFARQGGGGGCAWAIGPGPRWARPTWTR
jgi:phosphatidylserine/phosphatidylglycerophosphate/cardiolipin synthase-like enzyme